MKNIQGHGFLIIIFVLNLIFNLIFTTCSFIIFYSVFFSSRDKIENWSTIHEPSIYCIMITGKDDNRYHLAKKSINNFLNQNFKNKYLIIVNHSKTFKLTPIQKNIFELNIDKEQNNLTLGELRNIALSIVPFNALWITWDDDDYRHSNFLMFLYNVLQKQNADLVTFTKRLEYNRNTGLIWKMTIKSGAVLALCKKFQFFEYLNKNSMEDIHLIDSYKNQNKKVVIIDNDPKLYIRLVHENNTSLYVEKYKRKTISTRNKKSNYLEENVSPDEENYVKKIVSSYYNNEN